MSWGWGYSPPGGSPGGRIREFTVVGSQTPLLPPVCMPFPLPSLVALALPLPLPSYFSALSASMKQNGELKSHYVLPSPNSSTIREGRASLPSPTKQTHSKAHARGRGQAYTRMLRYACIGKDDDK